MFGSGLGIGGIELRRLIEVVLGGTQGDLVPSRAVQIESSLGRAPGGMEERWRCGLLTVCSSPVLHNLPVPHITPSL
ncbi:MAG: hypothetical protein MUO50_02385, partial [Longimicrobiales bacterium]|nr:hypothetical protein [Longimicrobiales bacterium]